MRLADFILANVEPILAEWETFARAVWPGAATDPATLRDHAEDILRATAHDMRSAQTPAQQSAKSKGEGQGGAASGRLDKASAQHGAGRVASGFDLALVAAEYRALRASVVRLWQESIPVPHRHDLDDLTRFHESIDQSLAEAVESYAGRVERSRQTFLGIIAHDLRNPLSAIRMMAEALARNGLDAESTRMASQISDSAGVMGRMIRDLLDFTATGLGGGMPVSPAPTDLGAVCQQVMEEMRAALPDCTLRCDSHGDLRGEWDRGRLRQLISNLLGNAAQHGGATCRAEVSTRADGPDAVVLSVHNDGPPIPPDALPTIFDPLVRGPKPERERVAGSIGLGLYIAREIVTAHGGTIDVTSSAQAGTLFTVRLPRRR